MNKQRTRSWIWITLIALVILIVAGGIVATVYAIRLPENAPTQETLIYGQNTLYPGSQAALRIVAREVGDASPIAGAEVRVALKPQSGGRAVTLFEGATDALGATEAVFTIPVDADPQSTLIVETQSNQGRDTVERDVAIERDYKVLLSTDKPIYQPGHVIHIRALALGSFDLVPAANQPLEITITDARGNKVFRRTLTTSEYGVTATDFQLATEVNTGNYKIETTLGNTTSEVTVVVKHYVLPKFKIAATTDEAFYLPGAQVTGVVDARYFFGKPVDGGSVVLTGYTFDVQLNEVFRVEGETGPDGQYDFAFDLPDYLVGGGLEDQVAAFIVEVAVTDGAAHTERINLNIPVARSRILIEAVPESGDLVQGVENIVYVITASPDGLPVPAQLTIWAEGESHTVESGAYGLAEWRFTPQNAWQEIRLIARDAQGNEAERTIYFEPQGYSPVLLRPNRAVANVGDTLQVDIFSPVGTGSLYLDIIREGQTVSTRALKPEGGHAQADIDLTPELYGSLELHGYTISEWGEIQRDTRIVVVDAPRDLNIAINADRETYLPGDTAALDFTVTGLEGSGVASVLGLAAVDESVFALQEQDPGFLKLYFLLEKELLEPKYDLHGFTLPEMITTPEDDTLLREAQDGAAQASMAGMTTGGGHTLSINTRDEKIRQLEERQMAILRVVGWIMLPFTLILPLSIAALTVIALTHDKVLGRSVLLTLGLIFLLGCLVMVVPMPDWVGGPLDRIGYLLDEIFYSEFALGVVTMLAFISMIAWIALLVRAIREKEWRRLFAQVTLAAHFVVFTLAILLSMTVLESADGWVVVPVLLALLLPPTAFLVWAAGDLWSRRPLPALGTFLLAGLALAAPLLGVAALENSTLAGSAQMGMDRGFGLEEPGMEGEWLIDEELAFDVAEEAPMAQEKEMPVATPAPTTGEAPARAEAPRLRQLFGETMAWIPELVTDDDGALELALPLYDNITTWRLTALAHSQDGRLGATTVGLRVFQDFFVDFDLPYAMTQNDEVALPIAVYNYLEEAQTVRLELEEDSWFELLDEAEKTLTIGANDVEVVRFRIKVTATQGRFRPTVWAYGEKMSDATTSTHDVIITPDGKPFELTWSDRLEDGMERTVEIPDTAAPGAAQIEVKIYPGIMSQVVEGMDAILQMPYGCFEQTSSTTYPNVLVLDYMQTTGQTTPEIQLKAEQYINLGYQRLTTFEVSGGGFSLFGDNPPDRMLTAYGLMEFTDMARVFPIDPAFVDRAAQWLIAQQDSDGSWENDRGLVHEQTWANLGNDRVPVTAYISWALTYAGYAEGPAERGLAYIREHAHQVDDPYAIALVANALVAAEPGESFTAQTLERLAALATVEGDIAYWDSGIATMMGSEGKTGSLETTALAAYAFLQADAYPDLANQALLYLIQQKDPNGTWYSTQATILALKALLKSATAGGERTNATVTVSVNGGQSDPIEVTPETYDVVRVLTFSDVGPGDNVIRIDVDGEGSLMAQITTRFYLPWSEIPVTGPDDAVMTIDVAYDRTTLAVDDMIAVQVTVTLNEPGAVDWALVDLGTPPGFTVLPEALQARINHDLDLPEEYPGGRVKKYELTGRQVLVYLQNLTYGEPLTFEYALRARFPVKAQAPASRTYDYYNPDARGEQQPVIITVEE